MTLLEEAREWLEKMKEHTDCCGTPIVRKLVAEVQRLEDALHAERVNRPIADDEN